jgi:hypothetical protein
MRYFVTIYPKFYNFIGFYRFDFDWNMICIEHLKVLTDESKIKKLSMQKMRQ